MAKYYIPSTTNNASNIKLKDTNDNYTSNDVEGALEEINAQIKDKVNKDELESSMQVINDTLDGKVKEVNNLTSAVNSAESSRVQAEESRVQAEESRVQAEESRVQAEESRTTTFNNIVSELEVTQTDIDDILGMIGGL